MSLPSADLFQSFSDRILRCVDGMRSRIRRELPRGSLTTESLATEGRSPLRLLPGASAAFPLGA